MAAPMDKRSVRKRNGFSRQSRICGCLECAIYYTYASALSSACTKKEFAYPTTVFHVIESQITRMKTGLAGEYGSSITEISSDMN